MTLTSIDIKKKWDFTQFHYEEIWQNHRAGKANMLFHHITSKEEW